jgi:hypothetical protein
MSKSFDIKHLSAEEFHHLCGPGEVLGLCVVCGEKVYENTDWAKHFPCEHLYHEQCWVWWYWKHRECPCMDKKKEEGKSE